MCWVHISEGVGGIGAAESLVMSKQVGFLTPYSGAILWHGSEGSLGCDMGYSLDISVSSLCGMDHVL